jgi:hypothetical protein
MQSGVQKTAIEFISMAWYRYIADWSEAVPNVIG